MTHIQIIPNTHEVFRLYDIADSIIVYPNSVEISKLAKPIPDQKDGYVYMLNEETREVVNVIDNRGKISYSIYTKESRVIKYLGDIEPYYTYLVPAEYDVWNETLEKWELDDNKMREVRYKKLERIFNSKVTGLKKLAIDKEFMVDAEAIDNQYMVYEEMYKNALNNLYDTATNEAIIVANEMAKNQLSELTLILNSVRSVIEYAISTNATNTDELIAVADEITFTKDDLATSKIADIKTAFNIQQ